MIAIDTNLLIYAHRNKCDESAAARIAIEDACRSDKGWGFSYPCLTEFWCVVTHAECENRSSTPEEADRYIQSLIDEGGATVWLPRAGFGNRFSGIARDLHVTGVRIFDLQIALIAYENGARTIWTHDKNFLRIPGLKVEDPLS